MSNLQRICEEVIEAGEKGNVFYVLDSGLNQCLGETSQMVGLVLKHIDGKKPAITGKFQRTFDLEIVEKIARALLVMEEALVMTNCRLTTLVTSTTAILPGWTVVLNAGL